MELDHLQELNGPGFDPRYFDSGAQSYSEMHCHKPQSTTNSYFNIITNCLFSVYLL